MIRITPREHAADARVLRQAGIGDAEAELWRIRRWAAGRAESAAAYRAAVIRRAARTPLSRIMGRRPFWQHAFELTPDVLDPRPESETLVAAALRYLQPRDCAGRVVRVLDLGTGSGCLLVSVLAGLPRATGVGADRGAAALAVAARNARRAGVAGRCDFVVADWGRGIDARFDGILCNPPYIPARAIDALPPEVAAADPRQALDGGADGLCAYRAIAGDLGRLLVPDGRAWIEIGIGQGDRVTRILKRAGLRIVAGHRDLDQRLRCLEVARA